VKRLTAVLSGFLLILLYTVVSPVEAKAAAVPASDETIRLTVGEGDCLYNICKKYMDGSSRWREIARINRLADPDLIRPGTKLTVPVSFLKRTPLKGRVTFVLGDARTQIAGKGEWIPLKPGDEVSQNSNLRTGEESALEVAFSDGSLFLLKADTEIGIRQAEQALSSYFFRDLYLRVGRVISRIKEATGASSRFKVRTPSAIASVRGTEFRVAVDEKEKTLTEAVERTVTVEAARKSVEVAQGEGTVVDKGKPPLPPRKLLPPPAPSDLKAVYNTAPVVRFAAVEGAVAYRVAVTADQEGKKLIREKIVRAGEPFASAHLADGSYFLFAQSIDESGLEGLSSGAYPFRVRLNPLPPITQTPRNGAKTKGTSQEFQWLSVGDAAGYHVQVAGDREFGNVVLDKTDVSGTAFRTSALAYKAYYFRISSVAADGYQGAWSDPLGFTLTPLPPTPSMDRPDVAEDDINLRSRSIGEGFAYRFQVAKDAQFKEIVEDRRTDKPEMTMKRPKETGTYYVRIAGIDRDGDAGEYSPPQSFVVKERFPYGWLGGSVVTSVLLIILLH